LLVITPGGTLSSATEEYNGSTWSGGGNMATATAQSGAAGTQTAAIQGKGGVNNAPTFTATNISQEYNGSTWTSGNNALNTQASIFGGSAGTQTAAILMGGPAGQSEEYDGTSWTAGGTMNTSRINITGGSGTVSSAIGVGGGASSPSTDAEQYDGSAWTTITSSVVGVRQAVGTKSGDNIRAFGGPVSHPNVNISYNGTSWESSIPNTTHNGLAAGGGVQTAAIIATGENPGGLSTATEEFTGEIQTVNRFNLDYLIIKYIYPSITRRKL
jgi:hypothetical protein